MTSRKFPIVLALVAAAASAASSLADGVQTVFVIAMENHNWVQPGGPGTGSPQQIFGNTAAPYINSLVTPGNPNAAQVSYAANYYNAGVGVHPSEPNYVWAEAGTDFGVHTDADPTAANTFTGAAHLTAQMNAVGVSWKNYQEDYQILNSTTAVGGSVLNGKSGTMTGVNAVTNPYYNTKQYNYAPKHDPMVFFTDTQTQNVNTFDQLRSDITADTGASAVNNFGQYNWITPNQYNDQHSAISGTFTYHGVGYTGDQSAIATGDNFLSIIVPQIMATQAYQNNGAIVIWWDESEGGDTTGQTLGEIVISPLAKGNAFQSSVVLNHSSDIKTMEEIFQLGSLLGNTPNEAAVTGINSVVGANDLSDLFIGGAIPTSVPEPASLAVLAVTGMLLGMRRRRA